jgi:hypothetical protein
MRPLVFLPIGYLVTILIETPILLVGFSSKVPFKHKFVLRGMADGVYLSDRRSGFAGYLLWTIACCVSAGGRNLCPGRRVFTFLVGISRPRMARPFRLAAVFGCDRCR